MKYKVTLNGKTYEIEVEAGKAMCVAEYADEQKLGFSYAVLDRYIREGYCEDSVIREKIDELHRANRFKLELIPVFESGLEEKA